MSKYFATTSPDISQREIDHMALSRSLAGECAVLLEYDGSLPIEEGSKIALYGNGARQTVKGGTGSGDVNSRTVVTIEQGLENAGYTITTKDWLSRYDQKRNDEKATYLKWIHEMALETGMPDMVIGFNHPFGETAAELIVESDVDAFADTAIYVISRNSGEGADRNNAEGDYLPFPEEIANLEFLGKHYTHVVLVLNIGGVMELTKIKEVPGVNTILLMTQLGNIGGDVLADIVSGKVTPSGKLTDTWAKQYSDYPSSEGFSHNDGNIDDEYYTEGIYVGYRYFDTFGVEPLYHFGYGKSYTTFDIKVDDVSVEGTDVIVMVNVTNTGDAYSGKEVVQVYYSAPAGNIAKPYQELAAFKKTDLLAPGESESFAITFDAKQMASYCEKCASWVLEAGNYIIRVGNSSRNTEAAAVVVLDETVKTESLKNTFKDEDPVTEITAPAAAAASVDGLPQVALKAADIKTAAPAYQGTREAYTTDKTEVLTIQDVIDGKCTVEELVSQLSVEELASFCVGTLRAGGGQIVGNASATVPGAAGDSSSIAKESRGIKGMIMADGPAGLRLQPVFKTTKDGELLPGGGILGDVFEPFDENLNEDEVDTYYQYCTAIPIGWALASAWNSELLVKVGEMVGREMEQFHVDLWLAPAMNIHRNPLCGRNFEYYSEDPLVAGRAAGAITKGVQSRPGKGTCIKHFAANSQEDNRYFTNSHVSERALREIYLKGFEIAVKETQPLSIMTSYNLINGIHAANNYDLLQTVCRDEWGFEGLVMTDWFTSQDVPALTGEHKAIYPISASTGCVYAGNDIQMPGCQKNVDDLVEAVTEGKEIDGYKLTLADLQFNAANVIRVVVKTMGK